ncbi:Calcium-activated potassium channel subunit alpha-1 [Cichlidogyrus casuarinus]|uniref:Calcium-activated potassium channel subunit alpha-1 n=1 Tax=Cichlidogyrus casuarinus TaxID=1844966 RepID=A0ABD2Q3V7_9PLAT
MPIAVIAEVKMNESNTFFQNIVDKEIPSEELKDLLSSQMLELVQKKGADRQYLAICPVADDSVVIKTGTIGFFVCDSQEQALRASQYCIVCHEDVKALGSLLTGRDRLRIQCKCRNKAFRGSSNYYAKKARFMFLDHNMCSVSQEEQVEKEEVPLDELKSSEFDETGMYHNCYPVRMEKALLRNGKVMKRMPGWTKDILRNHIVICILAKSGAPQLGLRSFVMPLRASNLDMDRLKSIVLMGDSEYIAQEWDSICTLPKVYVMPASPFSRSDLRLVRIQYCSMCVIISSRHQSKPEDPFMNDKEAILCSLNIRGMKFSPVEAGREAAKLEFPPRLSGNEIPTITELSNDGNVHYLDSEDLQYGATSELQVYMSSSFAMGKAFTSSVLDALASTAYFDRNTMTIIRHFVTGGMTPVLEQMLSEGEGTTCLTSMNKSLDMTAIHAENCIINRNRKRPRIDQIALSDVLFKDLLESNNVVIFGELFAWALQQLGVLCIGLFRLKKVAASCTQHVSAPDSISVPNLYSRRMSALK